MWKKYYIKIEKYYLTFYDFSAILTNRHADVAELADALDLGSSGHPRAGSSPVIRTKSKNACEPKRFAGVFFCIIMIYRCFLVSFIFGILIVINQKQVDLKITILC